MPMPLALVVKKALNSCLALSGSMPMPESFDRHKHRATGVQLRPDNSSRGRSVKRRHRLHAVDDQG